MTVDVVLPHELAAKVFGMYLFNTQERADLSEFGEGSIFSDEIAGRLRGLQREEQRSAMQAITSAIAHPATAMLP